MRYYSNLPDDLHCFQASLRMVLSKYFPEQEFSFEEIDRATGFQEEKHTWDSQGLLWLSQKGFRIVRISDFDYVRFAKEGEGYLRWFWLPEVYAYQKEHSDFEAAQESVKKLLPYADFVLRKPNLSDIGQYISQEDAALLASVNPRVLDGETGYANHTVVIESLPSEEIVFSDPGLPPEPHRKVSQNLFQKGFFELTIILPDENF